MNTYLACIGTRPEIIKMAPVYRTLKERGETVSVLHTGQHEDVARALYSFFDMGPDHRIKLLRERSTLSHLTAELLNGIDPIMAEVKPDVILVQGDTSSAFVGAMVGYYQDIPVAHIEAGLRTGLHDPFPEEKNRELIGRLASWHFPPTQQAARNLLQEGIPKKQIFEVGNTVIDAALWVKDRISDNTVADTIPPDVRRFLQNTASTRLVLVTAHRRENWGRPIQHIATAVGTLLKLHPNLVVVWPLHPNPSVRADIQQAFSALDQGCHARLCLTDPLEYPALISLLAHSYFSLTDSGGIQEEASALQRPVLITRDSTERQELVQAGGAMLVGTNPQKIIETSSSLLCDQVLYQSMQLSKCPFGDGHSAHRIVDVLTQSFATTPATYAH